MSLRNINAKSWMRIAAVMALAGLTAGCFQPLYGERSLTGGASMRDALAAVEIQQIDAPPGDARARMAVELRNELQFALRGGNGSMPATHSLKINITDGRSSIIVDPTTARAEYEIISLDATYTLTDLKTGKPVFTSTATARTSYDVPGQQNRYAMLRGQRNAQGKATTVIAEQIRNRLASHLAAGT